MEATKTYLVCPLNWGLGHASRLVPIVNQLLIEKQKVILCGDGNALQYLRNEFPGLNWVKLKDLSINFSPKGKIFNLIKIIPQLIYQIIYEHYAIKSIINKSQIDIIISDNRYGLWNKTVHSIFVTHQLMIKLPKAFSVFETPIHKLIKLVINKYNECWIPDNEYKNKSISGDLTHKYKLPANAKYIGPQSRFSFIETDKHLNVNYDIVVIISGPEPSRSYFENIIFNTLNNSSYKTLIIQGKPNENEYLTNNNITKASSFTSAQIKYYLSNTRLIICRSGYSSLMDLDCINRKAILVPTPGQTEQEYLAQYHKNDFYTCPQEKISLNYINQIMQKLSLY